MTPFWNGQTSVFTEPEGRLIVCIDLSVSADEMQMWPARNIEGYFKGVADAYGHLVAARKYIASLDRPSVGGSTPDAHDR
jgi:hypothetical protein